MFSQVCGDLDRSKSYGKALTMDHDNRGDSVGSDGNQEQTSSDFPDVLQRAKTGDADAIGQLCELSRKYLLLIANQDLQPRMLQKFGASDIVQQSMIVANNKIGQFGGDTKGQFLAWMRQIVINECRASSRKYRGTDKRNVGREFPIDGIEDSSKQIQLGDPSCTPSTEAVNNEQFQIVVKVLKQMNDLDRQVIEMRNWQELSFEEIGIVIGKTDDASRKIWSRAIVKLEQELNRLDAI